MSRIICDTYFKKGKSLFSGEEPNGDFNRRIRAVNQLYGWLYDQGMLEKVSFAYQDLPDCVCFAFDAKDLLPLRTTLEQSGAEDALLAVQHVFDVAYTPCTYSGAIELSWFMSTYRDVDGCVGRSWECSLAQGLNTRAVSEIGAIYREKGARAAVQAMFSCYNWPAPEKKPDLPTVIQASSAKAASEKHTSQSVPAPPTPER